MPYFEDGVIPDIIYNPHSQCTRKTVGVVLEGLINHFAINYGIIVDASPFGCN